jgi:formylmethanofuran dehydrogenase subunit E
LHPREMPGYKSARIVCARCGEGINYDREVQRPAGNPTGDPIEILCQGCADPASRYYQPLADA